MKNKKFDSVKMKEDIQSKLVNEFKNLSVKDNVKKTEDIIAKDEVLLKIWNKVFKSGKKIITK